ncbi:high mobility group B protein 7 isoform X1 [Castanea sativa]|uniref:high mobility group B protein 7 isoform X1 n=1 Tax=Castanea sativa TaxID=21020 RepID=UPI003F64F50D
MVYPTARTRKRVHAVLRAPDGSAFQKCESCGVSIAIALADMHECETEKELAVKRFRGVCGRQSVVTESQSQSHTIGEQPRSPFRLFMENFLKTCKGRNLISIDQAGFDIWKNMSKEEREPYIIEAKRVNSSYMKALLGEVNNMQEIDCRSMMRQIQQWLGSLISSMKAMKTMRTVIALKVFHLGKLRSLTPTVCPTNFLNFMKQMVESWVIEKSDLSSSLHVKVPLSKLWVKGANQLAMVKI